MTTALLVLDMLTDFTTGKLAKADDACRCPHTWVLTLWQSEICSRPFPGTRPFMGRGYFPTVHLASLPTPAPGKRGGPGLLPP